MTNAKPITFPVVGKQHGATIRRNAETGVEIRSTKLDRGGMEHSVYAPDREHGFRLVDYYGELASARDEAIGQVERMRQIRHDDHSDAITENAERALDLYAPELLAVDTDPEIAAEVAEANGLDEQATAELTEHARKQFPSVAAMLDADDAEAVGIIATIPAEARRDADVARMIKSAGNARTPSDARKFAEAARDLAEGLGTVPADAVEPLAADTDPEIAAEVAEANGLDAEDAAAMVADAEAATHGVNCPAAYGPNECARTADCPDAEANNKRIMIDLIGAATGHPEQTRPWFARHGIDLRPGGSTTVEQIVAAVHADHAEALTAPTAREFVPVVESIGLPVMFRDDFSHALKGFRGFEIDSLSRVEALIGKRLVGIRVYQCGRWRYRLAYLDDLRTEDGRRITVKPDRLDPTN